MRAAPILKTFTGVLGLAAWPVHAAVAGAAEAPAMAGIPVDFILFGLTLLGVALFHRHTLHVALIGLATITSYKLAFTASDGHGHYG